MRWHQRDNRLTQTRGRLRSEIRTHRRLIPIFTPMDQQRSSPPLRCQAFDRRRWRQTG
jgi:hypothetical protein